MKVPVTISIEEKTLTRVDHLCGGMIPRSRILENAIDRGMLGMGNEPLIRPGVEK